MSLIPLNLDLIRAEFPALKEGCVYLDNAGGSQVLKRVADRVSDYLLTSSVQLGASYAQSQAAGEREAHQSSQPACPGARAHRASASRAARRRAVAASSPRACASVSARAQASGRSCPCG